MTAEEKRAARLKRAVEFDFKQECRALLPLVTDQVAAEVEKGKLKGGDLLRTFETLRDTVHGKPAQAITGHDGGPLVVSFAQIVASVDGAKAEKL